MKGREEDGKPEVTIPKKNIHLTMAANQNATLTFHNAIHFEKFTLMARMHQGTNQANHFGKRFSSLPTWVGSNLIPNETPQGAAAFEDETTGRQREE